MEMEIEMEIEMHSTTITLPNQYVNALKYIANIRGNSNRSKLIREAIGDLLKREIGFAKAMEGLAA